MVSKCMGCGYCCCKAICAFGRLRGAAPEVPCSFLTYRDGRHWCKLVEQESVAKKVLAVDTGCSSSLFNDWRKYPIIDRTRRADE